ncbi:hypothetical protein T4D_16023 [Trichinella pseudospiralis]|uniref:Uncharacterized protein n=1 Tax=Trichinella pseudospiralis TaxID=6337 RepID=A0A0V1F8Y5_TRIPS|nr:hypothetical protein T4D_16023 [Trichinella pseudospiralis]
MDMGDRDFYLAETSLQLYRCNWSAAVIWYALLTNHYHPSGKVYRDEPLKGGRVMHSSAKVIDSGEGCNERSHIQYNAAATVLLLFTGLESYSTCRLANSGYFTKLLSVSNSESTLRSHDFCHAGENFSLIAGNNTTRFSFTFVLFSSYSKVWMPCVVNREERWCLSQERDVFTRYHL